MLLPKPLPFPGVLPPESAHHLFLRRKGRRECVAECTLSWGLSGNSPSRERSKNLTSKIRYVRVEEREDVKACGRRREFPHESWSTALELSILWRYSVWYSLITLGSGEARASPSEAQHVACWSIESKVEQPEV